MYKPDTESPGSPNLRVFWALSFCRRYDIEPPEYLARSNENHLWFRQCRQKAHIHIVWRFRSHQLNVNIMKVSVKIDFSGLITKQIMCYRIDPLQNSIRIFKCIQDLLRQIREDASERLFHVFLFCAGFDDLWPGFRIDERLLPQRGFSYWSHRMNEKDRMMKKFKVTVKTPTD